MEVCCQDRKSRFNGAEHELNCRFNQRTYQLLQYGAEELVAQGPGFWSGGKLGQDPPCKVTDPHLHVGVLQQAQDVLQQVLIQQVWL